ncbi:acyl-CoA dehydrogenase family protein [Microvirga puerhi]|nr:acyl-CoA dehydrogenase family protein [Microvirga puerhi]
MNYNEDQRQILDAANALLNTSYPLSRLQEEKPDDLTALAEFGAFALALPEERGGTGFTIVEEALVHGLLGRHLISSRALANPIAARLAARLGRHEIAEQVAAGTLSVCAAVPADDSLLLIDGAKATLGVVFGGRQVILIALEELPREGVPGLGHSVVLSRVRGPLSMIGECTDSSLLDTSDLLVTAQLLGIAEASRDMAVSYAKVREQFGRSIGSFQAIKHHCANMSVDAEALSALLDMAAIAVRDERGDAAFQVAALRLLAPRVAFANVRTCIQIHGGIGFSAEADAHHYLKQVHVLRQLLSGNTMLDLPAPLAPYTSINERN